MSIIKIFEDYYKDYLHQLNILPFLYNRETALLNKTEYARFNDLRNIRISEHKNFEYNVLNRIVKNKLPYNIYYSLAYYERGVPIFNFLGYTDEEKERLKDSWKKDHWKTIKKYDWLIDVDAKNIKELEACAEDTEKICNKLEKKKIPYSLRFSGCGFHVVIPYQYIPKKENYHFNPMEKNNIYTYCNEMNKEYYEKISELVDYGINDSRRIIKCPNTLVYNPEKTKNLILLCQIISKKDLKNFNIKRYTYGKSETN